VGSETKPSSNVIYATSKPFLIASFAEPYKTDNFGIHAKPESIVFRYFLNSGTSLE
jgi:hypothetical protein